MRVLSFFICMLTAFGAVAEQVPAESFAGEWLVYVVDRGEKSFLADYRCEIQRDGTAVQVYPDQRKRKIWGKISRHKQKIALILPESESADGKDAPAEKRGLIADSAGGDVIEFRSDFQPGMSLRLERRRSDAGPAPEWLAGTWSLTQRNRSDGEERTAPFNLVFSGDGRYSFAGKDAASLNARYAGSFEVRDSLVLLKNRCDEKGSLWFRTAFFRDGDRLVLNRLDVSVRAERLPASSVR